MQGFARQTVRGNREVYNKGFFLGKYLNEETHKRSPLYRDTNKLIDEKIESKSHGNVLFLSKTRNVSLLIYGAIFHETHTNTGYIFFVSKKQKLQTVSVIKMIF